MFTILRDSVNDFLNYGPQIGTRFALTAAHCLFDDGDDDDDNDDSSVDNEDKEFLPASAFSVVLGVHDREKTGEPNRLVGFIIFRIFDDAFRSRKQVRVSKIVVHENFTNNVNDIALLKLGIQDCTK